RKERDRLRAILAPENERHVDRDLQRLPIGIFEHELRQSFAARLYAPVCGAVRRHTLPAAVAGAKEPQRGALDQMRVILAQAGAAEIAALDGPLDEATQGFDSGEAAHGRAPALSEASSRYRSERLRIGDLVQNC